jgi:type IV secretory pathway VirB10-like protein
VDTNNSSVHQPIEAPSGLDLHPQPKKAVRISKRAGMAIVSVIVVLLLAFAYGGYRRTLSNQAAARDAGLPRNVTPATQAGAEFMQATPAGTVPMTRGHADELRPPDTSSSVTASCGADPKTGQPYRFNPQTGQLCDGLPQERVVVRQPNAMRTQTVPTTPVHEETPEDRRLAAAYQREQEAIQAPTSIRNSSASSSGTVNTVPTLRSGSDDLSQVEALSRALGARQGGDSVALPNGQSLENDYDGQNMQSWKAAFLAAARNRQADDYLRSTREAPLSRYEIKAGWEIPAVLEQSLNSDLPGELKALVTSNVYDTATGLYLLIPQGSRLIGKYDSRIAYGQDGVQVAWSRIIYPDASSVDLDGMMGLDSHGNAGLRDQIDRHYRRLIGFSVLTSMFTAAFEISQRSSQSALTYPTPAQTAGSAVGQELSQTGAQITRRNLNVQPTIKVPAGYKFTVRVNRDILFEAPYAPVSAEPQPIPQHRAAGPTSR